MAFISANQLQKLSGEDKLTDYQFGKKVIHHSFCSICGVRPYAMGRAPDGSDAAMVNVRCLDGIDVHAHKVSKQYDVKSL